MIERAGVRFESSIEVKPSRMNERDREAHTLIQEAMGLLERADVKRLLNQALRKIEESYFDKET
jgi:hypothetical protein